MTNFVPIFPLKAVVFPHERLNIHISERELVHLIEECALEEKPFGTLPNILRHQSEFGTLMEVAEIAKKYKNGSLDVRIKGLRVLRILEHIRKVPDKKYSGAIVSYPENDNVKVDDATVELILQEVMRLYDLLGLGEKFPKGKIEWNSYEIGHTVGLTLKQEYELLTILNEVQRMEYIRRHLKSMRKVVAELESLKARIQLNGQFRNLT